MIKKCMLFCSNQKCLSLNRIPSIFKNKFIQQFYIKVAIIVKMQKCVFTHTYNPKNRIYLKQITIHEKINNSYLLAKII